MGSGPAQSISTAIKAAATYNSTASADILADVDALAKSLGGRFVVQTKTDGDSYRTHLYMTAKAAENAVRRGNARGKRVHAPRRRGRRARGWFPMSAETLLKQIGARLGYTYTTGHEPSFWLHCRLVSLTTAPRTCGHPPLFGALWRDELACADCAPSMRAQGEDDFRCDRCAKVEHPIHVGVVVFRGLLVSFGLCDVCVRAEYGGRS